MRKEMKVGSKFSASAVGSKRRPPSPICRCAHFRSRLWGSRTRAVVEGGLGCTIIGEFEILILIYHLLIWLYCIHIHVRGRKHHIHMNIQCARSKAFY